MTGSVAVWPELYRTPLRKLCACHRMGPEQRYATPYRAIAAASAGDKIQIDRSASYRGDVFGWATDDLTIVG
jgi:hypothetical protein